MDVWRARDGPGGPDEQLDDEVEQDVSLRGLDTANERRAEAQLSPTTPGRTLLPASLARAVSFATRSTSLAVRVGTFVGSFGLSAAKVTTLSSLELGRGILEGILSRAGRDVVNRSQGELGRADAETLLEKSLENLHRTMTQVVFWTTTGFQLTGTTMSMVSDVSQLLLSSLDQFFGSTDSSRAIASIITLIRREFQNPATGVQGERVGVVDLVMGLCGLAYLQGWCGRLIELENHRQRVDEVVWDVVVLNSGQRVDVQGEVLYHSVTDEDQAMESVRTPTMGGVDNGDDMEQAEQLLKQQIMESLPQNASVSLTTTVSTTKTIAVDISGLEAPFFSPPAGFELVDMEAGPPRTPDNTVPTYRVVYRVKQNKESTTHLRRHSIGRAPGFVVEATNVDQDDVQPAIGEPEVSTPPPVPPKDPTKPRLTVQGALQGRTSAATANQKRSRLPPRPGSNSSSTSSTRPRVAANGGKEVALSSSAVKAAEKKGSLRNVFKKEPGPAITNRLPEKSPANRRNAKATAPSAQKQLHIPSRTTSVQRYTNPSSSTDTEGTQTGHYADSLPRTDYITVHERRRNSQTDTFSIHSMDMSRPSSPSASRKETASGDRIAVSQSERRLSDAQTQSPTKYHRRSQSHTYTPSIFTLGTNTSETSLVPRTHYHGSAYTEAQALDRLRKSGCVSGMFPDYHLLRNLDRYMRFSSASYGSNFLKFMKIGKEMPILRALDDTHHELRSFAHHTGSDTNSILLSSFVDPQGGSDSTGSTNSGVPLVHYISLDHESKAVVLACRGTLGFEDVLADMTCDYDELVWRGNTYKVHKGIHASARRLLYGGDGRVLLTLRQALEEFSDYGLILTGHSLGGAVCALLGVMLSEPALSGTSFVTSSSLQHQQPLLLPSSSTSTSTSFQHAPHLIALPPNRPIHVYAYGPPATMSSSLRLATRGLITSIVHGHDLVPFLSLGVLHDFQAVALAFKTDNSDAKGEVRQRIWEAFQTGLASKWYTQTDRDKSRFVPGQREDDGEEWAWAALKVLRASMMSFKLLPPGEVFVVESTAVLRRDAFVRSEGEGGGLGKPARRVVLKYVRDVEGYFREVRFGRSMLVDHSPGRYEDALARLRWGVLERRR
jgi:hypothetical protein